MAEDEILDEATAEGRSQISIVLYSVYDLAVQPADYRLVDFLVRASHYARKNNFEHLQLVLIPPRGEAYHKTSAEVTIPTEWLIRHILAPAANLMKVPCRPSIFSSREEASDFLTLLADDVYPAGYDITTPSPAQTDDPSNPPLEGDLFYVDAEAEAFVERWISARSGGRKTATVFLPGTTTGQTEWLALADLLRKAELFCILVPTLEDALGVHPPDWSHHNLYAEAASNTIIMAALMQTSHLNILPNDDRMGLCAYNPTANYLALDDLGETVLETSPELGNLQDKTLTEASGALSKELLETIGRLV